MFHVKKNCIHRRDNLYSNHKERELNYTTWAGLVWFGLFFQLVLVTTTLYGLIKDAVAVCRSKLRCIQCLSCLEEKVDSNIDLPVCSKGIPLKKKKSKFRYVY